jgi:hypothetical protein
MGNMVELSILVDQWDTIKKDPKRFVKEIDELMRGETHYGEDDDGKRVYLGHSIKGRTRGQATVYKMHHADEPRVYIAWRNSFVSIDVVDIENEYGQRLKDPNDHIHRVLAEELRVVEDHARRLRAHLKEKFPSGHAI